MTEQPGEAGQDGNEARAEASAKAYEDVAKAAQAESEGESADEAAADALDPALVKALDEAATYKDVALRAQAETENIRRRAARDVEQAHKFALEKFAGELLPVLDSIEKAVEAAGALAEGEETKAMAEGVSLCHRLFLDTFGKAGIMPIDPHGEPFDPEQHQAMAMIEAPHAAPNSVVDVLQKGYQLNGRLLRAAMVVVAKNS
jgi:molecular chaperone GrpE